MLFDSPSSFGRTFRIVTFGESHGAAVGVVLDGVKPGLSFDLEAIQRDLDRRRPGQSDLVTPRNEADRVQILSGVFEGRSSSGPATRTSPTTASTGSATPGAAVAAAGGRPWPGWLRGPGPSSSWRPWA